MIHPTAIIYPTVHLDPTIEIGPYAVIDENVVVGGHCRIGPFVHLTGATTIGSHNVFHAGCVIGDAPQDLKYKGETTRLTIGDYNVFREHVTIHRSARPDGETVIGSNNYFMANSHVGHDSRLANHIIIANGALLGGYVEVADRVFISGNCLVHQFTRMGTLSLMQGRAGIGQDLPPYTIAHEVNTLCGLNTVGLRRAGISPGDRLELKRLYQLLFRSGKKMSDALAEAQKEFSSEHCRGMIDFIAASRRGVCRHPRGQAEPPTVEENS